MAWEVGDVVPMRDPNGADGFGFTIIDDHHKPIVSFLYETQSDAESAARSVRSVIKNAVSVHPHG
jgi:hypothetical protein